MLVKGTPGGSNDINPSSAGLENDMLELGYHFAKDIIVLGHQ